MILFKKAKPIWLKGLSKEINLQAEFICSYEAINSPTLSITASTLYKVFLDDKFLMYGPARAAHTYYRVDEIPLPAGSHTIKVSVAGYNCPSYYTIDQPSFLIAEILENDCVISATGYDFTARVQSEREQKVIRYSFQRTFSEVYSLNDTSQEYIEDIEILGADLNFLPRNVELPKFKIDQFKNTFRGNLLINDNINIRADRYITSEDKSFVHFPNDEINSNPYFDFQKLSFENEVSVTAESLHLKAEEYALYDLNCIKTGFANISVLAKESSTLLLAFGECLDEGIIDFNRWEMANVVSYSLNPSQKAYNLETFEVYGFRYMAVCVLEGSTIINNAFVREYSNSVNCVPPNNLSEKQKKIFTAAVETYNQNSVDLYTDCPTRERAGWLCDSYFTAQAEFAFTGDCLVEKNFMQNYLLCPQSQHLPKGMLPMCYPADHKNGNYIPQWSMWFLLELEEYLVRDTKVNKNDYKTLTYNLLNCLGKYENKDEMLEKLGGWNFVEWSKANEWVQDVNYPTNMLYAKSLSIVGNIFNDETLIIKANRVANRTLELSFNGEFFTDNAIYKDNQLKNTGNISEACQYYPFFLGLADINDKKYSYLKNIILDVFGPNRDKHTLANIEPANMIMGISMRMELLLKFNEQKKLFDEIEFYYGDMADITGTLWEHRNMKASLNHGFASYIGAVILQANMQI